MIDVQDYYRKLANSETVTDDEIVALLKELDTLRHGAAHLASCQAATLEGLPKSTSKSQRQRHHEICATAAKVLQGDVTAIRYKTSVEAALERCLSAASSGQPLQN